jgi:hypothetical protein
MNKQRRDELRVMMERATPGEGCFDDDRMAIHGERRENNGPPEEIFILGINGTTIINAHDATFIVAAHEALPALLDDADRMEAELAQTREQCEAAEADLKAGWLCRACTKRVIGKEWCGCPQVQFINGPEKTVTCAAFEWRGPQGQKGEGQ